METIEDDGLYDYDFDGDWTVLEPFDCPPVTDLPPAAVAIIGRRLRINMADPDPLTLAEKMAANEWFWRRRAGQRVTFGQVMRGGSAFGSVESPDPDAVDADPKPNGSSTS